jgi:rod shape-determining protein MreD
VRTFWTALALVAAFLVQSGLTRVAPFFARIFDPFLLVLVYCGLAYGEVYGMLVGVAAGWIQDVQFGGRIMGLSGLSKVLVGFAVGAAGSRFQLSEPGPRGLVLAAAAILDTLIFSGLAAAFDVPTARVSLGEGVGRGLACACLGVVLYELVERRLMRTKRVSGY